MYITSGKHRSLVQCAWWGDRTSAGWEAVDGCVFDVSQGVELVDYSTISLIDELALVAGWGGRAYGCAY